MFTADKGKPIVEVMGEIARIAPYVEFHSEAAKRINGETIPGYIFVGVMTATKRSSRGYGGYRLLACECAASAV